MLGLKLHNVSKRGHRYIFCVKCLLRLSRAGDCIDRTGPISNWCCHIYPCSGGNTILTVSIWRSNITGYCKQHNGYIERTLVKFWTHKRLALTGELWGAFSRWRHQMETFWALLAISAGNSPVTGEFPTQRPVTRSLMFSLICSWINGWASKQSWG